MMPVIRVDEEVFSVLQKQAVPLVDTPNSVLRRLLLGEEGTVRGGYRPGTGKSKSGHLPAGMKTPATAFERSVLEALYNLGGAGAASQVVAIVGEMMKERLKSVDQDSLTSGAVRWQKSVSFARLFLVRRGLVKANSPRGVWELTDDGIKELESKERPSMGRASSSEN